MQQLGYFSLFIARELRIEDVNAFQASKSLRNCTIRVLKQKHGSHDSQKRSSPWCFSSLLSLCSSSVKSRYVFSRSVKVCRDRGSPARYGLSRMVLCFIPACHILFGPLTFCYVAIKFCYAYQVLSRFTTIKRGR